MTPLNGIKAIFLDAGHTLIYAYPSIGEIYSNVTAGLGANVPPDTFMKEFVPVFKDFVKKYNDEPSNAISTNDADYKMWWDITKQVYDKIPEMRAVNFKKWFDMVYDLFGRAEHWRFYDDAVGTLKTLRQKGYRLGVVSNWDTRLRNIVKGLGLDKMVDFTLISAEVGMRKPHPSIFEKALCLADVKPDEAIHVGDVTRRDSLTA